MLNKLITEANLTCVGVSATGLGANEILPVSGETDETVMIITRLLILGVTIIAHLIVRWLEKNK